ncbi:hypothetical protein BHM03_00041270 [Ensete ventricosum]|nr:hypothetical protein BHM03_00041270 [Ensete ventricosum]
MILVAVEATIAHAVAFLGSTPHRVGGFEESFLLDLEDDLSPGRVEWTLLLLGIPGGGLREDSVCGCFWSLRFSAIKASTDEELVFLLTHSKEVRDDRLWLGASEEVGLNSFAS